MVKVCSSKLSELDGGTPKPEENLEGKELGLQASSRAESIS